MGKIHISVCARQASLGEASDSAIDLPEAEDVFDNLCDRGFSEFREIRTAFFPSGKTPRGERGPYFQSPGRQYPLLLERMSGEK